MKIISSGPKKLLMSVNVLGMIPEPEKVEGTHSHFKVNDETWCEVVEKSKK
jgi:hypothetical protein